MTLIFVQNSLEACYAISLVDVAGPVLKLEAGSHLSGACTFCIRLPACSWQPERLTVHAALVSRQCRLH